MLLVALLLLVSGGGEASYAFARKYLGGKQYMVRLVLRDKNGTTGSLDNPFAYLSEKALERRRRQMLEVDSTDLPVSRLYLDDLKAQGVRVVCKSKWNNTVVVMTNSQQRVRQMERLSYVKNARVVWISPDSLASKSKRLQWHREFNMWDGLRQSQYGATIEQTEMLHAEALHKANYKGKGMTIAVLDGGFMNVDVIPAFRDMNIAGAADLLATDYHNGIFDDIDHGTKVLSTMAVNMPGVYVGTAPEASYWLLRCEDTTTEQLVEEDFWASAAEFADSVGVDIITSSLGYHAFDYKEMNYRYAHLDGNTSLISHTASMLADKGIVFVCSAGNDGMGAWKKINVPADANNIITVGAVTPKGVNASFSSVGPTADGRIKPDVMACGSPAAVITGRGTLLRDVGTSFAAPQVAGMVACLWQSLPKLTAKEIIALVIRNSSNYATPDNIYGYGIPDFSKRK